MGNLLCFENNPGQDFHHSFEIEHQGGKKGMKKMIHIIDIPRRNLKAGDDTRLGIYGTSQRSNLTGLIRANAIRIARMDKELGTQDFCRDLSGFNIY